MPDPSPILNNPYEEPRQHYHTDLSGNLDYTRIEAGRRPFVPDMAVVPIRQGPQGSLLGLREHEATYANHVINLVRREVGQWRASGYPNVTGVTGELLRFWFDNPDRLPTKRLFFAQREAVETAIWFNEIAPGNNHGTHLLSELRKANVEAAGGAALPRIAFKMATGSGKTVVMAMLILYHYLNRRAAGNDTRFADAFLLVAPGITIRDRLDVLRVRPASPDPNAQQDYYHARGLVPPAYEAVLGGLNARIVTTNFHAFEPRTLKGNKQSPFDGKLDANGKKQAPATESPARTVKRLLSGIRPGSRVVVLNDEAHHCYLPKAVKKVAGIEADENVGEENERASTWHRGLEEVARHFKLDHVYDLSATPYFLSGSGHDPYSLFGWVTSDFGLIEAIEAGLVKIPFLPEKDDAHELDMPVLRNLYDHVKEELPRKGRERKKSEAKAEGRVLRELPPDIPVDLKKALAQFYAHYARDFDAEGAGQLTIERTPPVFIVVCNNTTVSKEVYKYIAGFEVAGDPDPEGNPTSPVGTPGALDLFSNYDPLTRQPRRRPPTLLIDSEALEEGEQVSEEFRKVFAREIGLFEQEYRRQKGAAEAPTEAEILREVVNTVGKPGTLGGHVRCIVSVSMLTEGWDANTVTHIVGVRPFRSQLLCEQVAGRALRRASYRLAPHDKDRIPNPRGQTLLFPPEYAHIIGVPFKMFKGGKSVTLPPDDSVRVVALTERQDEFEIAFPEVVRYREAFLEGDFQVDFSEVPYFEIDTTRMPRETLLGSAVSSERRSLSLDEALEEVRDQQVVYYLTHALLQYAVPDVDGRPMPGRFSKMRDIAKTWYNTRVRVLNSDPSLRRAVAFYDPKRLAEAIKKGFRPEPGEGSTSVYPIWRDRSDPVSRTRYVSGFTTKPTYPTTKSHVNLVVADTDAWEQIAAKTFEEMDAVEAYVKNEFLGFTIPYVASDGKEHRYFPDFIARVVTPSGERVNLIVEITGSNKKDKADKAIYVRNWWLPAVNATQGQHGTGRWAFVEIANDLRDIKNQISAFVSSL